MIEKEHFFGYSTVHDHNICSPFGRWLVVVVFMHILSGRTVFETFDMLNEHRTHDRTL